MKHYILLCLSVITLYSCSSSRYAEAGTTKKAYLAETKNFLSNIRTVMPGEPPTILIMEPNTRDLKQCLDDLVRDSFFSQAEIDLVRLQAEKPLVKKWNKHLIDRSAFISQDTITSIFRDIAKGWKYFYDAYGSGFSSYAAPVFLRNNTLCLFYSHHSCGGLCGSGSLVLFQKENGTWKPLKFYCMWVS